MCENVNINVSETNETINIVATEVQEVIDINVFETAEDVTLNITEQLIQVNVNKVTAAEQIQSDWAQTDNEALDFIKNKPTVPTNTSDLINDGEDGVNPFITANDIPPVTGFVPYTGATENVNLGEFELKAGQLTLDTTPTGTAAVATTQWNDTAGVSQTTLKGGTVALKNGVDLVARVVNKVTPNATLLRANYTAVRISGAQGQRLAVAYAQANNDNNSADTIGLVCENIATNQEGFIMTMGQFEEINTTGSLQGETWADGDVLYLSPTTAGRLTNIKPTGLTGHIVVMGYVEYAHAIHGKIYVKIMNGWELDELHNVYINSPLNNDGLFYDSADSLWKNKTVETALGYTPENVANKSTSTSLGTSNTLYPTQNAVKVYADTKFTLPALTNGSVLFSNGTTIAQDNANLFWDDTNNRLGIGTNAPTNRFTLGATPAISLQQSPATLYSTNENTSNNLALVCADSGSVLSRAIFQGIRSRGTLLSPTAVFAGDAICTFISGAYDGAAIQSSAALSFDAESAASIGSAPQLINFITGSTGANRTTKMQVRSNGNVIIQNGGTFTDAGFKLDVNGTARVSGTTTTQTILPATTQTYNIGSGTMQFSTIYSNVHQSNGTGIIRSGASSNLLMQVNGGTEVARFTTGLNFLVGTTTDVASSQLTVESTTKGFLPPRMTTTQKNAIATPAAGLVVYDTTDNKHYGYNGTTWNAFY